MTTTEPSAYARHMKKAFEQPTVERWQKRSRRRFLIAAFPLLLAGAIALPSLTGIAWLALGPLAAFFPLVSFLNISVRGVTTVPDSVLDERQKSLTARSHMQAYYPAIMIASACILVAVFAEGVFAAMPAVQLISVYGIAMGILAALPGMILAWRLPDESGETE